MTDLIISNANIVNEGQVFEGSVLVENGKIQSVTRGKSPAKATHIVDAQGAWLLPGVIDDQVHFRDPGLTHKGDLHTESRAAAAGGITSFMEMPNTKPQAVTQKALADKYLSAAENSLVNYSFYMGATNDNLEELLKTDLNSVCGVKVFMGSSTGNMLVDNPDTLREIFSQIKHPIAVHCEDESTIVANTKRYKSQMGEDIPFSLHPVIRSEEACYRSSSMAVELAEKYGARLHVLHLSTAKEMELFSSGTPLEEKKITAEVCIHHLWFNDKDYDQYGARIKWNPAVKTASDQEKLLEALLEGRIDVVATDHAPHTLAEKSNSYFKAPSGGPLVQHALPAMLELYHRGKIEIEAIVEKMCHNPARLFNVSKRGFIRKGYWADMVLVRPESPWTVSSANILYKCGWSPFEGQKFTSSVEKTFVNGVLVYDAGKIIEGNCAMRLEFERLR